MNSNMGKNRNTKTRKMKKAEMPTTAARETPQAETLVTEAANETPATAIQETENPQAEIPTRAAQGTEKTQAESPTTAAQGTESTATPQAESLTIEMPLEGFTLEKLENLRKLVDSKAVLIKKAIGAEALPVEVTDISVKFAWFPAGSDGETVKAYSQFVAALCATAKRKTRIVARPQETYENEKFAMRVFGIGLGLVSDEYTLCRKLLIKNLTGDSSWRFTKPEKAENSELKPRREKVRREVLSIRLTPDTLEKITTLAVQKNGRYSRNMLIESIIEEYVKAAFPTESAPETQGTLEPSLASEEIAANAQEAQESPESAAPTETPTPAEITQEIAIVAQETPQSEEPLAPAETEPALPEIMPEPEINATNIAYETIEPAALTDEPDNNPSPKPRRKRNKQA